MQHHLLLPQHPLTEAFQVALLLKRRVWQTCVQLVMPVRHEENQHIFKLSLMPHGCVS